MLRRLRILNYALIESAELEFGPGLTIITGETGSGKSIMLGALSLLLGRRADSRVAAGEKARVEAEFEDVDPELRAILEQKGVEWIEEENHSIVTIRREISTSGKSRIFINDTPVTLSTLSAIGGRLIDIHSQHANAKLADPAEQLRVIDVMSDSGSVLSQYQDVFRRYATLRRRISDMEQEISRNKDNEAFLRFQYEQLDQLKPKRGELAEIERRYELLSDADDIKERFNILSGLLGNGERGLLSDLSEAKMLIERLEGMEALGEGLTERLGAVYAEMQDIAGTVEDKGQQIDTDPRTLEKLSERMQAYYHAVKHFRVDSADALVEQYESIGRQLNEIGGEGGEVPELKREAQQMARRLKELAAELTEMRRRGGEKFAKEIMGLATGLGLQNLQFEVKIEVGKLTSTGEDHVEFMCAFNKSGALLPVGSTASGGEMSRLMLSIKSVMARKMKMPTIIFDEVDTGVSGEIAERMGKMMHDMGNRMQVMAITHLPQVASQGEAHYKVYKRDEEERTVTHVERLDMEARVKEIAQMISGSEISSSALETARELLGF